MFSSYEKGNPYKESSFILYIRAAGVRYILFTEKRKYKWNSLSGKFTLSVDVLNFLCDWLRDHILKTDKKYAEYTNEKNITLP